jgi:hypothetical protein
MSEDTERVEGTPDAATAVDDSSYASVLTSEGQPEKQQGQDVVDDQNVTTQDQEKPLEDPEFVLKEGLKAKLSEIEEWRKGHLRNKDYTEKTQMLAEQRKSLESAFGGKLPDQESLQNLGKIYQAYFSDPKIAQVIDAVLSGQFDQLIGGEEDKGQQGAKDPYISNLEHQLQEVRQELRKFTGSYQERETEKLQDQAKQTWESWLSKRQQTDKAFKVSEDIDLEMGSLISGIRARHPDWDNSKILDHAYRLATVDQQPQKIAQQILKDADQAKLSSPPKITPKAGKKTDAESSYSDILTG